MAQTVAFVGGATGYTGRALVEVLAARGAEVWAHVRPDSGRIAEFRETFTGFGAKVDTTAWDETAMTERFATLRPTHVFALLGTTRARAKDEGLGAVEAYERIDYGLTMLLYRATAAAAGSARFVYLSAVGVGPESSNPYMAVRWRVETALREGDVPYTIVRPSFVTGADREQSRPLERAGAVIGDGLLGVAKWFGGRRLAERYGSVTGRQLAEGMARVAMDPALAGQVVHTEDLRG